MDFIKKHLIKIGLLLIVIGFLYEVFFVGVPYQDATEDLVVRYNRNEFIAVTLMQIGLGVVIVGIVLKLFLKRKKNAY